jgi:predicted amidophosphoribosyltransferase
VTGLPIDNKAVRRVSFHQSQTHLSRWQRQANIDSAFRLVDARRISNRHLLLIDDIVTTGSTLVALAQELQKAGNVRFSILSLGYTKS